ncbi:zinc-binding dehydrogenase [Streptomyces sp. NPDC058221]|uniref:zinc-binding dehydrogenase n=1 Tax=Streptomyces sp. NPDC058221 TaxID=3346388 RepID=UPI0036ED3DD3
MTSIKAVVVDPDAPGRLAISEVAAPEPAPSEAVVRVHTTSLNLGDVYRIPYVEAGWRPGWDLAGVVEQAAADGSGPAEGTRVLGLRGARFGAWGETVAVPTEWLAELPAKVSFAQAATLPTCGLTALYALERAGFLLNRTVLVTGASGGLGHFVTQLAARSGAYVVAGVRRSERADAVRELGATEVVVGEDISVAKEFGPYDVVVDQLGGEPLAQALPLLVPGGLAVTLGISAGTETKLNLAQLFAGVGGVELAQLVLFTELDRRRATPGLAALARMVAEDRLRPNIDVEASWTDIGKIAQQFLDRGIAGKAVLHFTP